MLSIATRLDLRIVLATTEEEECADCGEQQDDDDDHNDDHNGVRRRADDEVALRDVERALEGDSATASDGDVGGERPLCVVDDEERVAGLRQREELRRLRLIVAHRAAAQLRVDFDSECCGIVLGDGERSGRAAARCRIASGGRLIIVRACNTKTTNDTRSYQ